MWLQFMGKEPAASIPPLRCISRHISYLAAYRSDLEYSWQVAPPLFLDVHTLVLIDETLLCPNSLGGQHWLRTFFPTTKAPICGQPHLHLPSLSAKCMIIESLLMHEIRDCHRSCFTSIHLIQSPSIPTGRRSCRPGLPLIVSGFQTGQRNW